MDSSPLLPGATLGIFGGGQLGRMLALEAKRYGYAVHVFTPEVASPAAQVADLATVAPFLDLEAVARFAAAVDVVTIEFENVPPEALETALRRTRVHPSPQVLATTRHRIREKTFLAERGHRLAPYETPSSPDELRRSLRRLGGRGVLKTATLGYDGKGQARLDAETGAGLSEADRLMAAGETVLEGFVDIQLELSVVVARTQAGAVAAYPLFENRHRNHILDVTVAPARVSAEVVDRASAMATAIFDAFGYVGVGCVELFLTAGGDLLVNEIAPRPHNSGHLTFGAAATSQFAQQLRAVCGLPLGATELPAPAAMANLLGDLWAEGEPSWERLLATDVELHLYGKAEPRPGRKMGHLTAVAPTVTLAEAKVEAARTLLMGDGLSATE